MKKNETLNELPEKKSGYSRRNFLGLTGGLLVAGTVMNACNNDDDDLVPSGGFVLTNNDFGILNYAYALEQLEAAFYKEVITRQYNGITPDELRLLTDIHEHEVAHREFFKATLGKNAIGSLSFNFSSIDFDNRTSVLNAAKIFEDLGVSAYNGTAKYIREEGYLLSVCKIVSVEARHAAYIRDLIANGSFAGSLNGTDAQFDVSTQSMEVDKPSRIVLAAAKDFINTPIVNNLPDANV